MNKILIIAIVLIIIAAGGYFILKSIKPLPTGLMPAPGVLSPATPSSSESGTVNPETTGGQPPDNNNEEPAVQENIVIYADSGFTPNSLRVKAGATVTFKNESSGQIWIASAPHPIHTDYPEFDAKRGYGNGESYLFTFTQIGSWKYHNHLNPARTGTIIVE